jgi:hypothetical protein
LLFGCSSDSDNDTHSPVDFVTSDPGLRSLDDALSYVSKWVLRYDVSDTDQRLYFNNYYVTFTPTHFSFSSNFEGIAKGSYPYSLTRDGDGYILKIADWSQSAPGSPLKAIARIVYNPDNMTLVFTNPPDSDEYDWSVDGDTFLPDLTEYYAESSFASNSYVYIENNIPATAANKTAVISFASDGKLVTSDASDVFTDTTVNNKPSGIAWAVVGKERKLIAASYTDMGSLTLDTEKPLITLGGKQFAQRIALCGFICDYYNVDCCPYINGNWVAVDGSNNLLTSSDAAYFTIYANQGWLKATDTSSATTVNGIDSGVYGAGLASLPYSNVSTNDRTAAYGIAVTDDLTIYAPGSNLPLLTFVNLEDVDSQKEGNTASLPNPRIITFTPAGSAAVIRLKKL